VESHGKKPSAPPEGGRPASRGKKSYRSPRLTDYGSIAKLTQSTAGSGLDGGKKASQMMTCL
jgi:hypothetical protein